MYGSMVDIQSPTAEIRRGKEDRRKIETTGQNIMACPITQCGHNKPQGKTIMSASATQGGHNVFTFSFVGSFDFQGA